MRDEAYKFHPSSFSQLCFTREKFLFDSIAITQYTAELLAIVKVMCY